MIMTNDIVHLSFDHYHLKIFMHYSFDYIRDMKSTFFFFLMPLFFDKKRGKQPHPFRPYFELVTNPDNKTNKYAICFCCIEEHTRNVAITKKKCCVTNSAKLYLASCKNFKNDIIKELMCCIRIIKIIIKKKMRKCHFGFFY